MGNIVHYSYRLLMLGDECRYMDDVEAGFRRVCVCDFHIPSELIEVERNPEVLITGKDLVCCIYFSSHSFDGSDDSRIDELKRYSVPIIPVIMAETDDPKKYIPSNLSDYNGRYVFGDKNAVYRIISDALRWFGLIKKERKVFISYARRDGSKVAMQLFSELSKRGYDVFVDTIAVDKCEIIQDEIWHQMADSDLVVMLATGKYSQSTWCTEEFRKAIANRIGLYALIWPNVAVNADDYSWSLVTKRKTSAEDFRRDGCLRAYVLRAVADQIEEQRIANLATRRTLLVNEFIGSERDKGNDASYDFLENIISSADERYYPITGVPKSSEFNRVRKRNGITYLLYYSPMVRKDWAEYFDWINHTGSNVKTHGFRGGSDE